MRPLLATTILSLMPMRFFNEPIAFPAQTSPTQFRSRVKQRRRDRSKWSPADIRQMNKKNGVGRPPAVTLARRNASDPS